LREIQFAFENRILDCVNNPIVALPCGDPLAAFLALEKGAPAGWLGSLELSTILGVSDKYVLGASQVIDCILDIQMLTKCRLPLIVDIDAGYGGFYALENIFKALNLLRVNMAVMENKQPGIDKNNSMSNTSDKVRDLLPRDIFIERIKIARRTRNSLGSTQVCARFEDLVVGSSLTETLKSIDTTIRKAEPDAIFLSCCDPEPQRLFKLTKHFRDMYSKIPILTTTGKYKTKLPKETFFDAGISILILSYCGILARVESLRQCFDNIMDANDIIIKNENTSINSVLELNNKYGLDLNK
jgi:2-methylisocitrate lyase-like PEP mutase family enzyme